jgi:hypothetical protein
MWAVISTAKLPNPKNLFNNYKTDIAKIPQNRRKKKTTTSEAGGAFLIPSETL